LTSISSACLGGASGVLAACSPGDGSLGVAGGVVSFEGLWGAKEAAPREEGVASASWCASAVFELGGDEQPERSRVKQTIETMRMAASNRGWMGAVKREAGRRLDAWACDE